MEQNPLVTDAVRRVWCSPEQDYHAIFKLNRLTARIGARRHWSILMLDVVLPDTTGVFHLFSFGHVAPETIALFPANISLPDHWVWTSLQEMGCQYNVLFDVYFDNGVRSPLSECFITISDEKALILAVRSNPKIGTDPISGIKTTDISIGDVFLRIYKNAYFSSSQAKPSDGVFHYQCTPTSVDELTNFQDIYRSRLQLGGHVTCWRNGYLVNFISLTTCAVGDVLEFTHDTSVKEVVDFPIIGLPTFVSDTTTRARYLLHRPKKQNQADDVIDFHDDVDIFIWSDDRKFLSNGNVDMSKAYRQQGIYLHKNAPKTLEMVTHRDHSIPVSVVSLFLGMHQNGVLPQPSGVGLNKIYIRLLVRHSGYRRELVDDANRIKELYRLPDPTIVDAMIGVNALVPTWVARNLESSHYISLMGWPMSRELTTDHVAKAYGYDTVVNLLAKAVERVTIDNGDLVCTPSVVFTQDATAFEYDQNGFLIGWHYHPSGSKYFCRSAQSKYVEFVRGEVSDESSCYYGDSLPNIDTRYDWRFYAKAKLLNPQNAVWEDVTGRSNFYHIDQTTGRLTWLVLATHDVFVRSNQRTALIVREFDLENGLMGFLAETKVTIPGGKETRVSAAPFGEVDIWINGRAATPGIDVIIHWPRIAVVNSSYLNAQGPQKIIVRMAGMCTAQGGAKDEVESGFVLGGALSVDRAYDLRSGRASRYFLDGGIRLVDELVFAEDFPQWSTQSQINGKPYMVKDHLVEVKDYTGVASYELHAAARETDRRVSEYLTARGFGGELPERINVMPRYHRVHSPFISAIVAALKSGSLAPDFLSGQYSNEQVRVALAQHLYLLDYDPISDVNEPNREFVLIEPHCWQTSIALKLEHYLFIQRVIAMYAGNKVLFANHFTLSN